MNISYTEIDNLDNNKFDINNYNQNPYFDGSIINQKVPSILKKNNNSKVENQKPKKKSISYSDILSSMNTVVIDGKLQFVKKDGYFDYPEEEELPKEPAKKFVNINEPINPNMKNSYIYNKYFKNYKEPSELSEEAKLPKTKKELIKQMIINRINNHNERIRISQVKTTKLLYNNNIPSYSPTPSPIPSSTPSPTPYPNLRINKNNYNLDGNNHLFNLHH